MFYNLYTEFPTTKASSQTFSNSETQNEIPNFCQYSKPYGNCHSDQAISSGNRHIYVTDVIL